MLHQDFIMRLIERFSIALKKLQGKREEDPEQALRMSEDSYDELLGIDINLIRLMDASTIASMLRDPREIEPLVQLILFHAETLQLLERSNEAGELAAKGLALTSQWGAHEGEAAREVEAKLRALIG